MSLDDKDRMLLASCMHLISHANLKKITKIKYGYYIATTDDSILYVLERGNIVRSTSLGQLNNIKYMPHSGPLEKYILAGYTLPKGLSPTVTLKNGLAIYRVVTEYPPGFYHFTVRSTEKEMSLGWHGYRLQDDILYTGRYKINISQEQLAIIREFDFHSSGLCDDITQLLYPTEMDKQLAQFQISIYERIEWGLSTGYAIHPRSMDYCNQWLLDYCQANDYECVLQHDGRYMISW